MLNDEHKKKIQTALKVMEDLIKYLDGAPFDPRVITLIDVAASYLDEQHENGIEYPAHQDIGPHTHDHDDEEHGDEDEGPNTDAPKSDNLLQIIGAEEYLKELEKAFSSDDAAFKFLSPTKKPPKLEDRPLGKVDGDTIAEEIQKWFSEGEPDQWPAE